MLKMVFKDQDGATIAEFEVLSQRKTIRISEGTITTGTSTRLSQQYDDVAQHVPLVHTIQIVSDQNVLLELVATQQKNISVSQSISLPKTTTIETTQDIM